MGRHAIRKPAGGGPTVRDEAPTRSAGGGAVDFADNRMESVAQREAQRMADNRADASRLAVYSALVGDSDQVKAAARWQAMVNGPSAPGQRPVAQRYFTMESGQKSNDPDQFPEDVTTPQKQRDYVWANLLEPALKKTEVPLKLYTELRGLLLDFAMDAQSRSFSGTVKALCKLADEREKSKTPLSGRASPQALDKLVSATPVLADDKAKHTVATYTRLVSGERVNETFESDEYTKTGEPAPKGTDVQDWTRKSVLASINGWSCEVPLVRHLAGYVWPLLKKSKESNMWELKFREIDRLIELRESEVKNKFIIILDKPKAKSKSKPTQLAALDRDSYTVGARRALKQALLTGTKAPAKQQGVLFYDDLLKAAVPDYHTDAAVFELKDEYQAVGSLSMILTHWRPILLFDWILADDVLNNAST
jgi:hypothetical protein